MNNTYFKKKYLKMKKKLKIQIFQNETRPIFSTGSVADKIHGKRHHGQTKVYHP